MFENGRFSADLIETTDEEGNVHVFEKVDEYEFEGRRYALLIYQGGEDEAAEENEEELESANGNGNGEGYDEEVVVMRIVQEEDGDVFEAIEDEAEFERVVQFIEQAGADDEDNDFFEELEN